MIRFQACNSKMALFGGPAPSFLEFRKQPDNSFKCVEVSSNEALPNSHTTDLGPILDAKIPLQKVNTKVVEIEYLNELHNAIDNEPEEIQESNDKE